MKVIEETAKKVEDAINQGLAKLGATLDEVNVEVLESGGLFRKAKVRLTLEREEECSSSVKEITNKDKAEDAPEKAKSDNAAKPDKSAKPNTAEKKEKTEKTVNTEKAVKTEKPVKAEKPIKSEKSEKADKPVKKEQSVKTEKHENKVKSEKPQNSAPRKKSEEDKLAAEHALEFVKETIVKMGFEGAEVKADESGEMIEITAPSGDDSLIIGRHGETLSALSYLAETCARAEKCHINVTVDCNGYRERRAASLTALAHRRADECVNKRRKIKLEPMERIDRRTVHNALTDDGRVITSSEGKEPYRCVVIIPKKN